MFRLASLVVLAACLASPTFAQTCTTSWTSASGGVWSTAANWSDGVPTSADTACVTASGTYAVSLDQDQALGGLVVGGTSGTQTLVLNATLSTLGSGTIGANGVVEIENSANCGSCDGLPDVTGTLTVEGTLVHTALTGLLSSGGTVDIAPGGTLRVRTGVGTIMGQGGPDRRSRFIIRGTLLFDAEGQAPQSTVLGALDLAGGTLASTGGRVIFWSQGQWSGGTFDVTEGATFFFGASNGSTGLYEVSGTITGTPAGKVEFSNGAILAAASGDAVLDVGGTGIEIAPGSGQSTVVTSTGGEMVNAGRLKVGGNGLWVEQGVLRNEGVMEVRTSLFINRGGVVRNESTMEFIQAGRALSQDGTGSLINTALLTARREAETGLAIVSLGSTLRSQPGSELRPLKGARLQLDPPGSASLPEGMQLTGDGEVLIGSTELAIEGTISPGTEATPLDTLRIGNWFFLSKVAGNPQLVVDVAAGGASDLLEIQRGPGPSGSVRLAGALVVRVADGYTPQAGDTFTVLRTINTTNDIEDDFDVVAVEGAPVGIAFVAERNEDNSEIRVRAVSVDPNAEFQASAEALLGGGERLLFLSGPGAGGVTAARLECVECLDDEAFGTIPTTVNGSASLREVRVDLTSPRAYGFYELVLERTARPDTTIPLTVRPFLSYVVMDDGLNNGIAVRPTGLDYNWSTLRVWNVTNSEAAAFSLAAFDRQDPEQVALAFAPANLSRDGRRIEERLPSAEPSRPILTFGRIGANRSIPLTYGQRMAPEDVLFPEQTPTGPDDDRIPFGLDRTVLSLGTNHASFARTRSLIVNALRETEDNDLAAYLSAVDTSDPGAVERDVGQAIDQNQSGVGGIPELLEHILAELNSSEPVPSGLSASAYSAFEGALDEAVGDYMVASYEAINLDSQTAPASVQALLDAEVTALGGNGANSTSRMYSADDAASGGVCAPPGGPPVDPNEEREIQDNILLMMSQISSMQRERLELIRSVQVMQRLTQKKHDGCVQIIRTQNDRHAGLPPSGSCTFPPPPPGGPPGGGGGACTPPSAPVDPNDKTANFQFPCEMGTVMVDGVEIPRCVRYYVPRQLATEPIVYSVQFENLPEATANAEFVTITDELDPNLDPSTLEVYATSSDSTFSVTTSGQTVTFRFVGIDLPPNVTDPEGTGFVTFGVQPRAGLEDGTEIRNDASIVFDFNPPIETPEVVHEIREMADLAVTVLSPDFETLDQPVDVEVFVSNLQGDDAAETTLTLTLPVAASSVEAPNDVSCKGTTTLVCTVGALPAGETARVGLVLPPTPIGDYTITADASSTTFDGFEPNNSESVGLPIVGTDAEDPRAGQLSLTAGPNPSRGAVMLRWTLPETADIELAVYDLLGREVTQIETLETAPVGSYARLWDADVASGVYVIRLRAGDEVRTRRVTVIR